MANALPWSVRGIDPDIREQAVEAAHRSGMSVGQWLNQVLAGNLDDEDADDEPALPPARRQPRRKASRLEDLNDRLERLARPRTATAAHRFAEPDPEASPVVDVLANAVQVIERLERRAAANEARPAPPAKAREPDEVADAVRNLERKLDSLAAQRSPAAGAEVEAQIEQRLNNLLTLVGRMQPPPAVVHAAPPPVSRMAGPAAHYSAGGIADTDPAFARTLADIESRRRDLDAPREPLARYESPPGRPAFAPQPGPARPEPAATDGKLDSLRERLDGLVARIDAMRAEPRPEPVSVPAATPAQIDTIQHQLDRLLARIDELRAEPRPEAGRLQARLDDLTSRIEEWRGRPQTDIAALRADLAAQAAAIEKLSPHHLVGMVEQSVALIAEKAIRAQREGLPERLFEPLERMHEDVRAVLREVASSRGTDRLAQEVGNIARRLDLISQGTDPARLDEIARETQSIKALVGQAMRAQPFEGLARQIDALGRQIDDFRHAGGLGSDRAVLDAIRDVGDRLDRIDPAATFAGIESRLAAISGIEDKLAELARGMKKLARDVQPLPQLDTINERLEKIDRVLDSDKGKPFAGLNQLADRLDRIGSSLDKVAAAPRQEAQQDALVGMLQRLSDRMDRVQTTAADSTAFDALHDEIARLAQRIEVVGAPPAGIDGIERSVSDLFTQFDLARKDMRDVAESAASRAATKAAEETVRKLPRDDGGEALAAEGLLLIKRDLSDVKAAQAEAEKRTRSMLEAVHGTLETLVVRLSEAEKRARSEAPAAPAETRREPAAPDHARPAPVRAEPKPDLSAAASLAHGMAGGAPRGARAADSAAETAADRPLEPGLRPSAPSLAPQEGQLGFDPRNNFIAAARRAAQAAAEKSQAVLAEERPSRGKPGKPARPEASGQSAAASFVLRARKPLLLGLAALIFSVGALKVISGRNAGPGDGIGLPPPEKPALAKPAAGPAPAPDKADPSQITGSTGRAAPIEEAQPLPPETESSVPTLGSGLGFGPPAPNAAAAKRAQRLSESSAITQGDPLSVGSVEAGNSGRPLETGRAILEALANQSNLKPQDRLRDAVLQGSAAALFEAGSRFADGRGVVRDPKLAARWFEQAAAAGHGPSQYRLASLYREGKGITRDSTLAFQWFDRAAAQGHVLAMHNAAVLLAEGVHGSPDYAGAALWFKRAAEYGVKDSQFNIAILFARGLGVNQDLAEAYRWFAISALQGDGDAAKKRDDIGARLTKEQVAKENERAKAFKPNPANPVANEPGAWEKPAKQGA